MNISTLSVQIAILAGLLTVLSPCVLPILPVLIGRSLHSHRYGPVAIVIGLVGGFAVAGSLLGISASWLTGVANFLRYVAIAVLLGLGILALFPKWSYALFSYLPVQRWTQERSRSGLWGEFWLGTQLGLLWTPCAGPVLGGILVLAVVHHQVMSAFSLLLAYGLGAAIPLLVIAYGGRTLTQRLLGLRSHSLMLQKVGGIVVILSAIAISLGWDVQIQLWLAPFFPKASL
ncbi:cytochrome c biogenesis CcdA family protein [Leptolyngbya sp. AN03gr2]|uniref:cytochrome c biogenesis CcdA family protein n=1 Tax=unclassified Leptolyngbya TaxID=2650499 RepID=UPI003D310E3C